MPALPRTPTNKVKKAELRTNGITPQTWDRRTAGIVLKDFMSSLRSPAESGGAVVGVHAMAAPSNKQNKKD